MPGWNNGVSFGNAFQIQSSASEDIDLAQRGSADNVSILNYSGNPEGLVSANPSSLSHDRTNGDIYYKQSGTGNTGWLKLNSGAIPDPTTTAFLFDDFISGQSTSGVVSTRPGTGNTNFIPYVNGGAGNQVGIAATSSQAVGEGYLLTSTSGDIASIQSGASILPDQGVIDITFRVRLSFGSATALNFVLGLANTASAAESTFTDGVYFYWQAGLNSDNFVIKSLNTSTPTTANTSSGIDTAYHNYRIVIDQPNSLANFYIDGVQVANSPLSASITTSALAIVCFLNRTNFTSSEYLYIDYIKFEQTLTIVR